MKKEHPNRKVLTAFAILLMLNINSLVGQTHYWPLQSIQKAYNFGIGFYPPNLAFVPPSAIFEIRQHLHYDGELGESHFNAVRENTPADANRPAFRITSIVNEAPPGGTFQQSNSNIIEVTGLNNGTPMPYLVMPRTGNLGLGTGNPGARLEVWSANPEVSRFGFDNGTQYQLGIWGSPNKMNLRSLNADLTLGTAAVNDALMIHTSGNIGIGINSPASKLHVKDGPVTVESSAGPSTHPAIRWRSSEDGNDYFQISVAENNANKVNFSTQNNVRMTLTQGGRLGIGTMAPEASLDVIGGPLWTTANWNKAIKVNAGNALQFDVSPTLKFGIGAASSNSALSFFTTTADDNSAPSDPKLVIRDNGHIGIGTANPSEHFQIGDIWTFHNGGNKVIGYNFHFDGLDKRIANGPASNIRFDSDGSLRLETSMNDVAGTPISFNKGIKITNDGKIGIGTHVPYEQMQIGNSWTFHDGGNKVMGFNFYYDGINRRIIDGPAGGIRFDNGSIRLETASNGAAGSPISFNDGITVANDGKVGIGTKTPSEKMEVIGNVNLNDDGTNKDLRIRLNQKSALAFFNTQTLSSGNTLYLNRDWDNSQLWHSDFDNVSMFGNVGIGLSAPSAKLHIEHNGTAIKLSRYGYTTYSFSQSASNGLSIVNESTGQIAMYFSSNGNVSIGAVTNPQQKLVVDGTICSKEMRVSLNGSPCWADYVFADDYVLMPLKQLEAFISVNKHLPGVPTEQEVLDNGVELGRMDAKLLEKVEELTLYLIEQNKRIDQLAEENKRLQTEIEALKKK